MHWLVLGLIVAAVVALFAWIQSNENSRNDDNW